jgi:hypothetical protein
MPQMVTKLTRKKRQRARIDGLLLFVALFASGISSAWASAPTTTTLSITSGGVSVTTVPARTAVTLTATVASGSGVVRPGTINFCDATAKYCTDIHVIGTAQITAAGTATYKFIPGSGIHSYKAVFAGTNAYAASTSVAAPLTVPGYGATILVASGVPGNYTLTESIPGSGMLTPGGTVSFLDTTNSNYLLGTAPLVPSGFGFLNTTPQGGGYPTDLVVGDFNGDGIPDIVTQDRGVSGGTGPGFTILLGNGDGTFRQGSFVPTTFGTPEIIVGDFNDDGKLDILWTNYDGTSSVPSTIFLGNGDGTFTSIPGPGVPSPGGVASGDFNHDGQLDFAVRTNQSVAIFLGNGDGTFSTGTQFATDYDPLALCVGDFNNDGLPDLAVGTSDKTDIFLGNGDGTFTKAPSLPQYEPSPEPSMAVDLNGDGNLDLVVDNSVAPYYTGYPCINIFLGHGDGTFTQIASPTLSIQNEGLAVADLNAEEYPISPCRIPTGAWISSLATATGPSRDPRPIQVPSLPLRTLQSAISMGTDCPTLRSPIRTPTHSISSLPSPSRPA